MNAWLISLILGFPVSHFSTDINPTEVRERVCLANAHTPLTPSQSYFIAWTRFNALVEVIHFEIGITEHFICPDSADVPVCWPCF